jgi:uncharacterized protein DUF4350
MKAESQPPFDPAGGDAPLRLLLTEAPAPREQPKLPRLAFILWISLGVALALLTPGSGPLSPQRAEAVYGSARSIHSAAPDGLLAFAETIRRVGFQIGIQRSAGRPRADALVLLGPSVRLSEVERTALLDWVRQGGRLLYAPPAGAGSARAAPDLAGPDPADADAALDANAQRCLADSFCEELSRLGQGVEGHVPWRQARLGTGRIVLLSEQGAALSNAELARSGLSAPAAWLGWWLEGVQSVHFDEARIGVGGADGLLDVLRQSRFWPALLLGGVGLLLLVLAGATRRLPARAEPRAGSRDFGEHLDAAGRLLARDDRASLAQQLLLEGTRRRLGPRAQHPDVQAILESELGLTPLAAELWTLEARRTSPASPASQVLSRPHAASTAARLDASAQFTDKPST